MGPIWQCPCGLAGGGLPAGFQPFRKGGLRSHVHGPGPSVSLGVLGHGSASSPRHLKAGLRLLSPYDTAQVVEDERIMFPGNVERSAEKGNQAIGLYRHRSVSL